MIIIASCSAQENFHTLSFFFDGVPNPDDEIRFDVIDSLKESTADISQLVTQDSKPVYFIHLPYLQKECTICHNQGRMGSLNESQPDLCYQCHSNFGANIAFEHGPVDGGYCTECHDPHKAKEENLLLRTGQEICFHCHQPNLIVENVIHNISEEKACSACHNPHGSHNQSLLSTGSCYKCHDDFTEEYNVVHGPVGGGLCSTCHTSHHAGAEHLLLHTDRNLCFYCHSAEVLLSNETHQYIEDTNCTECHNPHGGEDRFMFN